MPLTPDERALLPTPQDVAFYQEHGYWISPPCISAEALQNLRYGTERYYSGERDFPLLADLTTDWTPDDGPVLRQNDYLSLQIEEFRQFLDAPLLFAMAARLARTPSVRLFHDQLVYKPPGAAPDATIVGWHTDRAYWSTCSSVEMLSVWVPLVDCTEDMGPMVVLDTSHRWPGHDDLKTFHSSDLAGQELRIRSPGGEIRRVPMALSAGQVSFHHCRTIHGSYPNRSDRPRIAWAIHLQDAANGYVRVPDSTGRIAAHINDILCRRSPDGAPDYADPGVCPVLFEEG